MKKGGGCPLLDKDEALRLISNNESYPMLSTYTKLVTKINRQVLGREAEMERVLSSFERPEISNVILLGDAGSGKGHTPDTPIAVNDGRGYIPFGDLKVGDFVFDEFGNPTEVTGVYPQGKLPVYEVVFEDGSRIKVNGDHLWTFSSVNNGDYDKHSRTLETKYISELVDRGEPVYIKDPQRVNWQDEKTNTMRDASFQELKEICANIGGFIDDECKFFAISADTESLLALTVVLSQHGVRFHVLEDPDGIEDNCFIIFLPRDNVWLRELLDENIQSDVIATRIIGIHEMDYEDDIICIMVDNPTHLYQVGFTHIVTHNTTLVSGLAEMDPKGRLYMEVDLSRMVSGAKDANEMGAFLKQLADEVETIGKTFDTEVVLFMDEIHQIMKLSDIAMEALKPILANSGIRGIRIICATTYAEFDQYIAGNQALVERLQRINLLQPGEEVTVSILDGMAKRYIPNVLIDNMVYHKIYEYTNRYIPANSQPRKSLDLMDAMIGEHRLTGAAIDEKLIGEMLYRSQGVRIALNVNPMTIRDRLDSKVYAQGMATQIIEDSLQNCLAGLNNPDKPMATLLFTGSTGVGKMVADDVLVPTPSGKWVKHGDLKKGDYVFNRHGKAIEILDTFKHKNIDMYNVTLEDGRSVVVGGPHLWTVFSSDNGTSDGLVLSTEALYKNYRDEHALTWYLHHNSAVTYEKDVDLAVDPYIFGYFLQYSDVNNRAIPRRYLVSSLTDRWSLVKGLFDQSGILDETTFELYYKTKHKQLSLDVSSLLRSLGIPCRVEKEDEYKIFVNTDLETKYQLFYKSDYVSILEHALESGIAVDNTKYNYVGITNIEPLGKADAQCIYVNDPEHLYLIDDYIVTHNTEISKQLANILFEDPRSFIRFDMTEYSQPSSVERFRDEVTRRVWERPFSVLLFDEIEKACGDVTRMLLQITDDARLINRHNREVSFKNCYILITTNAGAEIYDTVAHYMKSDTGEGNKGLMKLMPIIKESLRTTMGENKFPPELLGRLTAIVPFQPLSENTRYLIATAKVKQLQTLLLKKHGVTLQVHKRVLDYIIRDNLTNDANDGGGRAVITKLETEVTTEIARFINQYPEIKYVRVIVEGELASETKYSKESKGEIVVESYRPNGN